MGISFTKEQQSAIEARGSNLLVSAAAGSGKTAVLVERIITRLTQDTPPLNVDQLLVVTYTEAAAAEMKERIRKAIERALESDPQNEHLQLQAALIHQAKISTMHQFYTTVIHENFHALDLEPNIRVGEVGEIELIKREVLEKVLEEAYEKASEEFITLVESYEDKNTDTSLESLIMKLFLQSQSHPNPEKWLKNSVEQYVIKTEEEFEDKFFVKEILEEIRNAFMYWKGQLEYGIEVCDSPEGPASYKSTFEYKLAIVEKILRANSWKEMQEIFIGYEKMGLSGDKKNVVDPEKKDLAMGIHTKYQKYFDVVAGTYFLEDFQEMQKTFCLAKKQMETLVQLVQTFATKFAEEKRQKNLIDFSDMEHMALRVLTEEVDGMFVPSDIAKGYQQKFEEIMIDEYQDINRLQDIIMTSVSGVWEGKYNLFMVGDVKQSIYRFRLSCPELFMQKYYRYSEGLGDERRIDLHQNFRSRKEVLDSANFIFEQIMTEEFGGIVYDDKAALHVGAKYNEGSNNETEVLLLDMPKMASHDRLQKEAEVIALKIKELVGRQEIYNADKENYQKARYKDIVILLRAVKGVGDIYAKTLRDAGIPVYMEEKEGYFESYEIQLILNYLRILDNPRQDIPLTAVLSSFLGKVTAEELALIRNHSTANSMYECVKKYVEDGENQELQKRLARFCETYARFRSYVPYMAIRELLWRIFSETGFMEYMAALPKGEQKVANLEMLMEKATAFETSSYKGLFNFVRYIGQIKEFKVENGPASLTSDQMDAVTIMSVHKSKGLEFPIVFAARCGKKIDTRDASGNMIMHSDIGVGIDAVDPNERTKTPTFLKSVISRKIIRELEEEEVRLLYVAMTRAREKLFLVGSSSSLGSQLKGLASLRECKDIQLPYYELISANTFLDWILRALCRHSSMAQILQEEGLELPKVTSIYTREVPVQVHRITLDDIENVQEEELFHEQFTKEVVKRLDVNEVYHAGVKEELEQQREYASASQNEQTIKQKLSVSELKKQSYLEEDSEWLHREEEVIPLLPKFLKEEEELSGALRGTAYHRVMELLDFRKEYDIESLQNEIETLQEKHLLTKEMATCVRTKDVLKFLDSNIGKRMRAASLEGKLYAEQPFVLGLPANQVYLDEESEEIILIQGIVDAYFEEQDQLVVVDYKTDRVFTAKELCDRYKTQLAYYAEALQRLTGKEVKERIIYSFALQQEIEV